MLHSKASGISKLRSKTMDDEIMTANSVSPNALKASTIAPESPTASPTPEGMFKFNSDTEERESETSSLRSARMPPGLVLKGGRVRLPDKLMEYLNKHVAPEALYWMPEGECFAIDTVKAPGEFLNKYFGGTKVTSFLRSISRWGFKRVFYHDLGRHVYAFHHPLFRRDSPHLEREMKMIVSPCSESLKAKKKKKEAAAKKQAETPPAMNALSLSRPVARASMASIPSVLDVLAAGQQQQVQAPSGNNQALLQSLLQHASTRHLLVPSRQMPIPQPSTQLAGLPSQATSDGVPSASALQSEILNLFVARQQQQQKQQRDAALALQILTAFKSPST